MKYAAVVLVDGRSPFSIVDYNAVTDALLAGGVFLSETALLPYDATSAIGAAISRLSLDMDGVFVVCDAVLLPSARRQIEAAADARFEEEFLLETKDCLYAALPAGTRGAEIVRSETLPRIDARRKNSYCSMVLRTVSAPTEKLQSAMEKAEAIAKDRMLIHLEEKYGVCRIELVYDRTTPKMTVDEVSRTLATELADYLYALEDVTIAERLVDALKLRRLTISTAESFTGGGVGRAIVRVPGASMVYTEGLNTYSEQSKIQRLGVSEKTLAAKGAVSDETVYEMAAGLIRGGGCDIAIATTGAAGPSSPQADVPVGLCFLAVGTKEQVKVFRYHLTGNREAVTETAINLALFLAYKQLK